MIDHYIHLGIVLHKSGCFDAAIEKLEFICENRDLSRHHTSQTYERTASWLH